MIINHSLEKAVFTVKSIIDGDEDVLLVIHDNEDEWQFLSAEDVSYENMMMVTLKQIIVRDNVIEQVLNLPLGYEASRDRVASKWVIIKSKT